MNIPECVVFENKLKMFFHVFFEAPEFFNCVKKVGVITPKTQFLTFKRISKVAVEIRDSLLIYEKKHFHFIFPN